MEHRINIERQSKDIIEYPLNIETKPFSKNDNLYSVKKSVKSKLCLSKMYCRKPRQWKPIYTKYSKLEDRETTFDKFIWP